MTANVAASIRAPVSARDWFQRFYEDRQPTTGGSGSTADGAFLRRLKGQTAMGQSSGGHPVSPDLIDIGST